MAGNGAAARRGRYRAADRPVRRWRRSRCRLHLNRSKRDGQARTKGRSERRGGHTGRPAERVHDVPPRDDIAGGKLLEGEAGLRPHIQCVDLDEIAGLGDRIVAGACGRHRAGRCDAGGRRWPAAAGRLCREPTPARPSKMPASPCPTADTAPAASALAPRRRAVSGGTDMAGRRVLRSQGGSAVASETAWRGRCRRYAAARGHSPVACQTSKACSRAVVAVGIPEVSSCAARDKERGRRDICMKPPPSRALLLSESVSHASDPNH